MIEYSCYVKNGKGPKCRVCTKALVKGDPYARMLLNNFAKPYFHAQCLVDAGINAKGKTADFDKILEEHLEEQKIRSVKLKESRNPFEFKKQIIRDSLVTANVSVKNLSIKQIGWRPRVNNGKAHDAIFRIANSVEVAFKDALIRVDTCGTANNIAQAERAYYLNDITGEKQSPDYAAIYLTDPKSLEKLGQAILKYDEKWKIISKRIKC